MARFLGGSSLFDVSPVDGGVLAHSVLAANENLGKGGQSGEGDFLRVLQVCSEPTLGDALEERSPPRPKLNLELFRRLRRQNALIGRDGKLTRIGQPLVARLLRGTVLCRELD